jgi:hypothetical protein
VCVFVCVCACVRVCVCVCVCVFVHVCEHTHILHAPMHTHIFTPESVHLHIERKCAVYDINMHTPTHPHTPTHTQTHTHTHCCLAPSIYT